MPKHAYNIIALATNDRSLDESDWTALRQTLQAGSLDMDKEHLKAMHSHIMAECRQSGENVLKAYLDIRKHLGAIFVAEDVDHALNNYIDLCEHAFVLHEAVQGPDIRLFEPLINCGLTGIDLAHHLLHHENPRVTVGIFGQLHGGLYCWGHFVSKERIAAQACLDVFPTCEVVAELKAALAARNRAFEIRYLLEDHLTGNSPTQGSVTPLFEYPAPDTAK